MAGQVAEGDRPYRRPPWEAPPQGDASADRSTPLDQENVALAAHEGEVKSVDDPRRGEGP
jgi:hypothetical protein